MWWNHRKETRKDDVESAVLCSRKKRRWKLKLRHYKFRLEWSGQIYTNGNSSLAYVPRDRASSPRLGMDLTHLTMSVKGFPCIGTNPRAGKGVWNLAAQRWLSSTKRCPRSSRNILINFILLSKIREAGRSLLLLHPRHCDSTTPAFGCRVGQPWTSDDDS